MAIYRLLQKQAFGPDDIERMTVAYEAALKVLRLANRSDPITEIVAERILEIAQIGMRHPAKWCAAALKDFPYCAETIGRVGLLPAPRSGGRDTGGDGTERGGSCTAPPISRTARPRAMTELKTPNSKRYRYEGLTPSGHAAEPRHHPLVNLG